MAAPRSFDRSLVDGPLGPAVWKIAWPTMLTNVISGLQGMIDHVMVGHYVGAAANAAIGVSWQIFLVVVVFVSSIYTGMGVLVARFAGAGDQERVDRTVYQAFLVSAFLGLGVMAPLGYALAPRLLDLVHAAPQVQAEALPYLRLLFLWSYGMLLFFLLSGALRAAGDAKTPLQIGLLVTVLNLGLNVVLIRGLGPVPAFGTRGAALGTVIASAVAAAYGIYRLSTGKLPIHFARGMSFRPDWPTIAALFRFGLPAGFQGIAMNVGGVLLVRYVGSLPESAAAQAVYAVGYTQLFSLVTWTSVALMGATATLVGQNLGAGKPERAMATPRTAAAIGLAVAVPVALAFRLIPGPLLAVFGMEAPALHALGSQLLAYLAVSALFVTVALTFNGALQGSGDTRSPLAITLVSQLVLPLSICAVLQATRGLHAADIWTAIVVGHVTRCSLSFWRFRQGRWRTIAVDLGDGRPG